MTARESQVVVVWGMNAYVIFCPFSGGKGGLYALFPCPGGGDFVITKGTPEVLMVLGWWSPLKDGSLGAISLDKGLWSLRFSIRNRVI